KGVSERDRDGATDGEPVQTVGQVHRVRRSNNHEREKQDGEPSHVRDNRRFEKWNVKGAGLHFQKRTRQKDCRDNQSEGDLKKKFHPATYAVGFFLCDFEIIINETEHAEINHGEKSEPDEAIVWTRPKKTGNKNSANNHDAAHRRRSLFATVQLRKPMNLGSLANWLAELERRQNANDEIPEQERDHERSDRRGHGAKGDVRENVECADLVAEPVKIVHHTRALSGELRFANASITSSVRARRLPLIKTRSPGAAMFNSSSAASDVDPTTLLFSSPAFSAAREIIAPISPMPIKRPRRNGAAASPTSSCPRSDSFPSSRISPSTAIFFPSVSSSTKVCSAAFIESGFAL